MQRILIVSNRLPLQINIEKESVNIKQSVGGLATGIKSIYRSFESLWIGWPGIVDEEINDKIRPEMLKPYVDYLDIDKTLSSKLQVWLTDTPDYIHGIKIIPGSVEYLIEK